MTEQKALVELPSACAGRGEYVALIHYASPQGDVFSRSLKYSYKDPRSKDRREILHDIARMVSARERRYIIAISVIKRCLHPKLPMVPKISRRPHFERLFLVVVRHPQTTIHPQLMSAGKQPLLLPYTPEELRWLPIQNVMVTRFSKDNPKAVRVPLRGSEQIMVIDELLEPALHLAAAA